MSTFTIGFDERGVRRASPRAARRRAVRDRPPRARRPPRRRRAAAGARRRPSTSRSPTRRRSRPTSSRELARRHVKVALSGEGGDELFGGYNYYAGHALARRLAPAAWAAAAARRAAADLDRQGEQLRLAGEALRARRTHVSARAPLRLEVGLHARGARRPRPPGPASPRRPAGAPSRVTTSETEGSDELSRLMGLDLGLFLVDDMLVKTDRASMAHSLEARVPILDTVVAELALALPSKLKVRGLAKKRLLRQGRRAAAPARDPRGQEAGFSPPIGTWLRERAASRWRGTSCHRRTFGGRASSGPRWSRSCSTSHADRPSGQQPQDLGAADVLALVRPLRPGRQAEARPPTDAALVAE